MTDIQKNQWIAAAAEDPEAVFSDGAAGMELISYGHEADEKREAMQGAVMKDMAGAGLVFVSGEPGLKLLRRLLASDAEKFSSGQAFRSVLLNASGGVMLEVHVLALPGNAWRLVLPPSGADAGLAWMRQVAIAFEAHVQAMASGHAFWLAGPRAAEVLEKAGVPAPRDGAFKEIAVREGDAFLSVAAFSGLYLIAGDAESASEFWNLLKASGARPAGEHAFEVVRALHCLPAPWAEYDEMSSPLECGFEGCVDFSDPSRMFIGRALTEARSRSGLRCRLGLLEIESREEAENLTDSPDVAISGNDAEGGLITSWVKVQDRVLALALLPASTQEGAKAAVSVKTQVGETVAAARVSLIAH